MLVESVSQACRGLAQLRNGCPGTYDMHNVLHVPEIIKTVTSDAASGSMVSWT